jgi:polar amino acid transport system substrate-binding protein
MRSLPLATIWLLSAWACSLTASARPLQQVLNQGNLRVGVALRAPWALRTEDRNLIGFEIDVANKVAEDMNVKAEILVYSFDALIPALESGEIDMIAAGLSITPERALHVNFSIPYANSGVSLATNLAATANVRRLEDLNVDDYKTAAIRDSVSAQLARRLLPRAELVLFDDLEAAGTALLAGTVDAYLEEEPVPAYLALENPAKIDVPIATPLLQTRSGFAIAKGDADFLAFLNAWITAREADTWLPTTHGYWFKSLAWRN